MKSEPDGKNTSKAEITNISAFGVWLILDEKEYYLSYSEFPWFKNARVNDILNLQLLPNGHLYWPALDIDLHTSTLENLENYPMIYK